MTSQSPPLAPPPWQEPGPPTGPGRRGGRSITQVLVVGGLVVLALLVVLVVGLISLFRVDDPETVAHDYLEAGFGADYEKYCEMWTEESQQDMLAGADVDDCDGFAEQATGDEDPDFRTMLDDIEFEVYVGEVTEDEDDPYLVTVEWALLWRYDGDDPEAAESMFHMDGRVDTYDGELDLVKEDGEWRVDADSF